MDRQCAPKYAGLHIALDSLLSAAALALAVLLYQILLQRHHINIAVIAVIVIAMWQLKMISMILFIIHVSGIAFARIDAGAQPFKRSICASRKYRGVRFHPGFDGSRALPFICHD